MTSKSGRQPGARFALAVLTLINLLNYVDRCGRGKGGKKGGRKGRIGLNISSWFISGHTLPLIYATLQSEALPLTSLPPSLHPSDTCLQL